MSEFNIQSMHMTRTAQVVRPEQIASVARHYRTPLLRCPMPVYADLTRWQANHVHEFTSLSRFGDANCVGCGANAWSAAWVAEGVFGEGTAEWALARIGDWSERVDAARDLDVATEVAANVLGAEVVSIEAPKHALLAQLDAEEPAKHAKRSEGKYTRAARALGILR